MKSEVKTVEEYIASLPEDRKEAIIRLRDRVKNNLPKGFSEEMNYGMIGYVVPLSLYPKGYLGNKQQPLPFINIASQKNFIAIYHMGIYADPKLMHWFTDKYETSYSRKPDMGKSCIRFKKIEHIPFELIGELCTKISVEQWIQAYENEKKIKKRKTE
ncbi:MAG: DUF1801 domain-containing protein [Spirochaetales bacterium]|nr:DUF1801 domain-containing protein [Spirochaetales bacterium]